MVQDRADISEEEGLEQEDDDEHTCKEAWGPEDSKKTFFKKWKFVSFVPRKSTYNMPQ